MAQNTSNELKRGVQDMEDILPQPTNQQLGDPRSSDPLHQHSSTIFPQQSPHDPGPGGFHQPGNRETTPDRDNHRDGPGDQHLTAGGSSQEKREAQDDSGSQEGEQLHLNPTFRDGGHQKSSTPPADGRLDDLNRPERWVPPHSGPPSGPTTFGHVLERKDLHMDTPPLRLERQPLHLLQSTQRDHHHSSTTRHQSELLHGRPSDTGEVSRRMPGGGQGDLGDSQDVWMASEHGQVSPDPNAGIGLFGIHHQHGGYTHTGHAEGEADSPEEGDSASFGPRAPTAGNYSEAAGQNFGNPHCQLTGGGTDPHHDQTPVLMSQGENRLGFTHLLGPGRYGGVTVVAREHQDMEGYPSVTTSSHHGIDDGRLEDGLGSHSRRDRIDPWILHPRHSGEILELSRTLRGFSGHLFSAGEDSGPTSAPQDGQYYNDVLHQWPGRTSQTIEQTGQTDLLGRETMPSHLEGAAHPGRAQHQSRRAEPTQPDHRMGSSPGSISAPGGPVGTTYDRQICHQPQPLSTQIQLQVLPSSGGGHGCNDPGLVSGEQLHQSTVQDATPDHQEGASRGMSGHDHRSIMAISTVVPNASTSGIRLRLHLPQVDHPSNTTRKRRTTEKQMEHLSLQDIWEEHAIEWDLETRTLLEHSLRPSTLKSYDGVLTKFRTFCTTNSYDYFPTSTATVAHFFRELAQGTERPGPILISASAAIAGMYKGSPHEDPTKSELLTMLKQALVNTGTKRPRRNTPTFPIDKLANYISDFGENGVMTIEKLRAKAVCLLALVGLFRPSDLALITMDQVTLATSTVTFANFGGKTDKDMAGIPTTVTASSIPQLCPVRALTSYITRTQDTRAHITDKPVFIYLNSKTPAALGTQRIAKIMTQTLKDAGIDETTARSFRKTGASAAINRGTDPDLVMKLGRWKSVDVFYKHYVDWVGADLTDSILS